jgi:hypothetical protein
MAPGTDQQQAVKALPFDVMRPATLKDAIDARLALRRAEIRAVAFGMSGAMFQRPGTGAAIFLFQVRTWTMCFAWLRESSICRTTASPCLGSHPPNSYGLPRRSDPARGSRCRHRVGGVIVPLVQAMDWEPGSHETGLRCWPTWRFLLTSGRTLPIPPSEVDER